jgi:hypothetical protein
MRKIPVVSAVSMIPPKRILPIFLANMRPYAKQL